MTRCCFRCKSPYFCANEKCACHPVTDPLDQLLREGNDR